MTTEASELCHIGVLTVTKSQQL